MANSDNESSERPIEAVVAIFESHDDARRAASALNAPELEIHRVSRTAPGMDDAMPEIVYDKIDSVSTNDVTKGALEGGAIGAGSGLLLMGIPGLNLVAPVAGAIAGAWIGAVAGLDEANRGVELPDAENYRAMLAEGKSFVVISGDEKMRLELANKLKDQGATDVHQHPPVLHAVREPKAE